MKFAHLADLHLGKRFGEFSMLEDQAFALDAILKSLVEISPDALLIAGDVYDKTTPCEDAVTLADDFLTRASEICPHVCLISGNHDSLARLSFAGRIMSSKGIHLPREYDKNLQLVRLSDADIWLLPHIRPREVSSVLRAPVSSAGEAIEQILSGIPRAKNSIIISHQFVTSSAGVERCDSEIEPIGGLNAVDCGVFDGFGYVALGHLHKAQRVGRDTARYSGSPLKYSFSEVNHKKSFVSGEIDSAGSVKIELIPIPSIRDARLIEGTLDELISMEPSDDFICATVTDDVLPVSPATRLAGVFSRLVSVFWRPRSAMQQQIESSEKAESPDGVLDEFFRKMSGRDMSEAERAYVSSLWESVGEAERK